MQHDSYDYGLWTMVVVHSAIILLFSLSFYQLQSKLILRSFGAY